MMNSPIIKRFFQLGGIDWLKIIIFVVFLPLLIALLQFVLIKLIIPLNISPEFVTLLSEKPTISGMFLANYFHSISDSGHLMNNYISTIISMGLIAGMIFIALPAYDINISRRYLSKVFLFLLLILPFIISISTLVLSKVTYTQLWGYGFSGIGYALTGFGVFLCLLWVFEVTLKEKYNQDSQKAILELLLVTALISIFIVLIMLFEIGGNVNVIAHIVGYFGGLITPLIIRFNGIPATM